MSAMKWALVVVGVILLLMGTVFALQGENIIKGSSLMSGNPTYIYVGAGVAVIGLVLIVAGAMVKSGAKGTQPPQTS
jgi:hypothetical protein